MVKSERKSAIEEKIKRYVCNRQTDKQKLTVHSFEMLSSLNCREFIFPRIPQNSLLELSIADL